MTKTAPTMLPEIVDRIKSKLPIKYELTKIVFVSATIGKNLANNPKNTANIILEPGPAIETFKSPYFLSFIKLGLKELA